MNLEELRQHKPEILAIAERSGVTNIRVFGSVARGDTTDDSDVDLLVKALPGTGWNFFGFGPKVEDILGCKVDVISENGINKYMREDILNEAIPL